jgi:hypothetical protein
VPVATSFDGGLRSVEVVVVSRTQHVDVQAFEEILLFFVVRVFLQAALHLLRSKVPGR